MKKALPLLFLLMLAQFAVGQTCTNNVDNRGNLCTNYTTKPHGYTQTYGIPPFYVDTEDGQASTWGSVAFTQPYNQVTVALPFDPLNGSHQAVLNGYRLSSAILSGTPGQTAYTEQWTFGGLTEDVYTWSGTFTVTYSIQGWVSCGGRAHKSCPIYSTGPGVGELSAVHK